MLEQRRTHPHLAPSSGVERRAIERGEPGVGDAGATEQSRDRTERDERIACGEQHEDGRGGQRLWPPRTEQQPGGDRREQHVPRMSRRDLLHPAPRLGRGGGRAVRARKREAASTAITRRAS